MTIDELITFATAAKEGRLEHDYEGCWKKYKVNAGYVLSIGCDSNHWRITPVPKLRKWTPKDVPPLALYCDKSWSGSEVDGVTLWSLITSLEDGGFRVSVLGGNDFISFEEALANGLHSTDGGKTWKPCGVEE